MKMKNIILIFCLASVLPAFGQITFFGRVVDAVPGDDMTTLEIYAKVDASGNPSTIVGYSAGFAFDGSEASVPSISAIDFSPLTSLGWSFSGNTNFSENLNNSINGVSIIHDRYVEIQAFDGNGNGTVIAPGTEILIATVNFDMTPGNTGVNDISQVQMLGDANVGIQYLDELFLY